MDLRHNEVTEQIIGLSVDFGRTKVEFKRFVF